MTAAAAAAAARPLPLEKDIRREEESVRKQDLTYKFCMNMLKYVDALLEVSREMFQRTFFPPRTQN